MEIHLRDQEIIGAEGEIRELNEAIEDRDF